MTLSTEKAVSSDCRLIEMVYAMSHGTVIDQYVRLFLVLCRSNRIIEITGKARIYIFGIQLTVWRVEA